MKTKNTLLASVCFLLIACSRDIKENAFPKDVSVSVSSNFISGSGFVNNSYSVEYTVTPKYKRGSYPVIATFVVTKDAKITAGIKEYTEKDTLIFALNRPRELKITPTESGTYRLLMTFKDNKGTDIGTDELIFNIVWAGLTSP